MLIREQILQALRSAKPVLESHGVEHVWLFGSFARNEACADSDVDLLVEFSRPIGLFEFVRLQRELGERIGQKVELVTRAALKPQLRDRILAEAVFAAYGMAAARRGDPRRHCENVTASRSISSNPTRRQSTRSFGISR